MAVQRRAAEAQASGAMHTFESALEFIEDAGVEFIVRRATRYPPGETAAGKPPPPAGTPRHNPFAAPEPALVVADLGRTHVALLNKYNVVPGHLLVVTREYVDQHALLDQADFQALAVCMRDADVLAFYNGGVAAGASQPHKHLQLVSLPLSPRRAVPMAALLQGERDELPFRHALARLDPGDLGRPALMLERYRTLLDAAGVRSELRGGSPFQCAPYNLVVTRDWMLLVPRSRESFEGMSINSLAFAGSLFVRDEQGLQAVARAGPMAVLKTVALAGPAVST